MKGIIKMKYNKKGKMSVSKKVWSIICLMSLYPVAFAQTAQQQYIDSAHGQANNADSATAGYVPGVDQAPKTFIGGETGGKSQAATQQEETMFTQNCPAGTSGTNEYSRKIYVREDGSIFANEWYLKKINCVPNKDEALGNRVSNLENNYTNLVNTINNYFNNQGKTGNWASEPFVARYYVKNGYGQITTITGGGNAACITGFNVDFNPVIQVNINGFSNTAIAKPYPSWTGTQQGYPNLNIFEGPICPQGSGLNYLTPPAENQTPHEGE